jgi:hypothetical protein
MSHELDLAAKTAIEEMNKATTVIRSLSADVDTLKAEGRSLADKNSALQRTIEESTKRQDGLDLVVAKLTATQAAVIAGARRDGDDSVLRRAFVQPKSTVRAVVDSVAIFSHKASIDIDSQRHTFDVPGLLNSDETFGNAHAEMKNLFEAAVYLGIRQYGCPDMTTRAGDVIHNAFKASPAAFARISHLAFKAGLTSTPGAVIERIFGNTSGTGGDWAPTAVYLPELMATVTALLRNSIAGLFPQKTLNNVNNKNPLLTSHPRPFLAGSATATTAADYLTSDLGTGLLEWAPKMFAAAIVIDKDASLESILDNLAEARGTLAQAIVYGVDDAIMNGDTAASHQDSLANFNPAGLFSSTGAGGALDHRKAFIGLRARAMDIGATAKVDGGTFADTICATAMAKLNDGCGSNPDDLAWFTSNANYFKNLATLDAVKTMEKYGANASISSGEVAKLFGVPVIKHWTLANTGTNTGAFNASGLLDSNTASNTKHVMQLAARSRFMVGRRMALELASMPNPLNGTETVIAKAKVDFRTPDTSSTVNTVTVYNIPA